MCHEPDMCMDPWAANGSGWIGKVPRLVSNTDPDSASHRRATCRGEYGFTYVSGFLPNSFLDAIYNACQLLDVTSRPNHSAISNRAVFIDHQLI